MIPRSTRRPTRRQSRNLLGSMSLVFFTIFALILLCPVAVNAADEDKKSEFGTVIGIGQYMPAHFSFMFTATDNVLQILVPLIHVSGEPPQPRSMMWQFRLTGLTAFNVVDELRSLPTTRVIVLLLHGCPSLTKNDCELYWSSRGVVLLTVHSFPQCR